MHWIFLAWNHVQYSSARHKQLLLFFPHKLLFFHKVCTCTDMIHNLNVSVHAFINAYAGYWAKSYHQICWSFCPFISIIHWSFFFSDEKEKLFSGPWNCCLCSSFTNRILHFVGTKQSLNFKKHYLWSFQLRRTKTTYISWVLIIRMMYLIQTALRRKLFTMRVVKYLDRLPRDMVEVPSLETLKIRPDVAPGSLL